MATPKHILRIHDTEANLFANLKDTQIAFATDTNRIIWREGSSFWTFDAGLKWNGTNFEGNEVSTGVIKVYQFNGTEALQIGDGGGNPNLLTTGILTLNADQLKLTLANTTGSASKLLAVTGAGKVIEIDVVDLQDAYDNGTLITTDNGAVTLKNGGSLDSDNVIEVQNIAGTTTTAVTGDGQVQLDSATFQPQIVFNSNGGVDLNHYIQYNPGGVGGLALKSQESGAELTLLELNRNSSGEFKLSGNNSDTTKSAQVINTYSTPSDEAYLQLISRNDKTATKSATITVSSGSTDLATDSEISLSADKVSMVGAVLNLGSTTNGSPTNGDIWYDGTNVNVQGDVVIDTSTTESALKFQRSNINNWWIRSRSTNTLRFSSFDEATGSFLNSPIELMPFELALNGKIGLNSYTNGSPTTGDIWYDGTNVNVQGLLKAIRNSASLRLYGTDHTFMEFYPTGASRQAYFGFASPSTLDLTLMNQNNGTLSLGVNNAEQVAITDGKTTIKDVLNLNPISADPSSPSDGDIWYNSTSGTFKCRANGVTETIAFV